MPQHMIALPDFGFVDKRRAASRAGRGGLLSPVGSFQGTTGNALFTATGAGTTTTMVGAAANLTTSLNCPRIGERFMLVDSTGKIKEETVFEVTAHNGTTTITFTPAAAVATASGDKAVATGTSPLEGMVPLDKALINSGVYTQAQCDKMTLNDKIYALRVLNDPTGF